MSEPPFYPPDGVYTFTSTVYPDAEPWQWIYARALVRPLAVCMLPMMIGALVTVLQGYAALAYLIVGFPVALLCAAGWTWFSLQASVAELHVRPGAAAVRSVWDSARARPLHWAPIFELRATAHTLTVALGDTAYELDRAAWPDADALLDALKAARAGGAPS